MAVIVLSNREPYAPRTGPDGRVHWAASIGGLTTALDPVMQREGGTWIAWAETHPEIRTVHLPEAQPRYRVERLALSEDDVRLSYHGFCNGALWPMSHYFLERAQYRREEWDAYRRVNETFAQAALACAKDGDVFWVHDYQLALVPGLIRRARPDARIGFFWHIPWPAQDVFRTLPWDRELLDGLLGADLIGMHTPAYTRHFLEACTRTLGAETDVGTVRIGARTVQVEARPIGIDMATFEALAADPVTVDRAQRLRDNLRTLMLLCVDRLDYTKGIPERLAAFSSFLERHPAARGRVTLVQVAVPSREQAPAYRQLRTQVEGLVGRINGQFSRDGWTPVHYLYRGLDREELVAHYRAADAMLVTPLRDGLNLVAKEFAASSQDGVLLLSRFAGAADELPGAIEVNPYDVDGLSSTLIRALRMPLEEKKIRLEQMRQALRQRDLRAWTADFLRDLAGTAALPGALLGLGARPLLILCDYDGTLAPIARVPRDADPQPGALQALSGLLHHPRHRVAVVTGRRSVQVYGFLPLPDLTVVGLHGMEWPGQTPPAPQREVLERLARQFPAARGVRVEDKRWTVAVHYRNVAPAEQPGVERALDQVPLEAGWERIAGKAVREFRPSGYGKGRAVRTLIGGAPGWFPVFIGDDATDEEAFAAVNAAGGLSVKVGAGETAAQVRLHDPAAVVALLSAWADGGREVLAQRRGDRAPLNGVNPGPS
ncbi:bifunctional alpha,alpha-trehalose-phosphate synthase (UDP-forming)/trehalose-phosphatase [Deinococcus soli (ex Cha et al. 2016)]|uniref:Alpha,alpha-trehalose-phosphate synthase [UDP-forming]/trehalose-phosphatase n=2 Tax=Deinococcus soli (ex Cha et al. 2016) TaxID=1309411 RepID=A0AAE4BKH7_9DEIO|nr:bifunctional alpha,alpha-trehalose-phosphate synthase (UDP-forming)/trehalose-phosphatase [Deinococcus soli (ex Cha et al. 2016)]MDR6217743.1 alpha,alpha-trehalose-phosphate synthase [UDP-forming]/trehalose-phosphatase [Deinococcus soli (ex Cha et al. 2016)]MDR6327993.1 alpha,alpha-trehalose-phosphate synthase [UDP-forming]/trehalose-phosphatase [Deinococcus soli (ex Cha et al. 2016)]MDR6750845.1 alpha,alpha-trehalose-phosphate synthase [UDP-forming]/trehalose-phosphatase [Deinococcus soli (e